MNEVSSLLMEFQINDSPDCNEIHHTLLLKLPVGWPIITAIFVGQKHLSIGNFKSLSLLLSYNLCLNGGRLLSQWFLP